MTVTPLTKTLNELKTNPAVVVELYKLLFEAEYFAIVRKGTEELLNRTEFLTYETEDSVHELPLFTADTLIIQNLLNEETSVIHIAGQPLWSRLLDLVETGKCEVAIDPEQGYSIRLTKEMILGMISSYGTK